MSYYPVWAVEMGLNCNTKLLSTHQVGQKFHSARIENSESLFESTKPHVVPIGKPFYDSNTTVTKAQAAAVPFFKKILRVFTKQNVSL